MFYPSRRKFLNTFAVCAEKTVFSPKMGVLGAEPLGEGVEKALPLSDGGVKLMDPVGASPLQDDVKRNALE